MNATRLTVCGVMLVLALAVAANGAIVVTTSTDPNVLAGSILGSGITLVGTPTYVGGSQAAGTFTGGASTGIGIDKGLVLTTGNANLIDNNNNSDSATGGNGLAGDANLSGLVGATTYDASRLSFDFTTTGGDLFFNFVFASEEYNEYTHSSFNDVFAFFLDGVNIALIPGTTIPVAINTVNGGNPYGVNAQNPALFNNNDLSDGGPFYAFEYDGFTDVFTASALGLSAGTHHIALAIADTADYSLDSAVFIQGGSFSDEETPVPDGGLSLSLLVMACSGLLALRRK